MRRIHYTIYSLKMEGSYGKKFGWPLNTESSPPSDSQPENKGLQSYRHKELNSAHNRNEPESGFFSLGPPDENLTWPIPRFQWRHALSRNPSHAVPDF